MSWQSKTRKGMPKMSRYVPAFIRLLRKQLDMLAPSVVVLAASETSRSWKFAY